MNSVSPGPVMTGRRLSMIEKWASVHRVSEDEAKQMLLLQAGISRPVKQAYEGRNHFP